MIALSIILSMITIFHMPQGGGVTAFSFVPIMIMSYRYGIKWGMFTGLVYGVVDCVLGLQNVMYCPTLISQIACIFLDYLIPKTLLGCTAAIAKQFKNEGTGVVVSSAIICFFVFLSSFLSGILLWAGYAPEGTPVWIYSLLYNGSYMLPESLLTIAGCFFLYKTAPNLFKAA